MMPRSEKQHEFLRLCGQLESEGKKPEHFAPNMSVVGALQRRGLVAVTPIGSRWWRITLTDKGRKWSAP